MTRADSIAYSFLKTKLGNVLIGFCGQQVVFVSFGESKANLISQLKGTFPTSLIRPTRSKGGIAGRLGSVIDGARSPTILWQVSIDLHGTPFQRAVWRYLQTIPSGSTVSYADVAAGAGRPRAIRAAASACGKNKIAILVPCHRVICSNGRVGHYRWGSWRKRSLLQSERLRRTPPPSRTR
jgi:AraC family transcriptional regulator of adaptative response/methylated-DNA-[protein]-cysteine methyltransferase